MAATLLAVIGAIVLVLHSAGRVPAAVAVFLRALIPLERAWRALRAEIGSRRLAAGDSTEKKGVRREAS